MHFLNCVRALCMITHKLDGVMPRRASHAVTINPEPTIIEENNEERAMVDPHAELRASFVEYSR